MVSKETLAWTRKSSMRVLSSRTQTQINQILTLTRIWLVKASLPGFSDDPGSRFLPPLSHLLNSISLLLLIVLGKTGGEEKRSNGIELGQYQANGRANGHASKALNDDEDPDVVRWHAQDDSKAGLP